MASKSICAFASPGLDSSVIAINIRTIVQRKIVLTLSRTAIPDKSGLFTALHT